MLAECILILPYINDIKLLPIPGVVETKLIEHIGKLFQTDRYLLFLGCAFKFEGLAEESTVLSVEECNLFLPELFSVPVIIEIEENAIKYRDLAKQDDGESGYELPE